MTCLRAVFHACLTFSAAFKGIFHDLLVSAAYSEKSRPVSLKCLHMIDENLQVFLQHVFKMCMTI